jgi:D-glycero-D-manno-heptose 1,7-bisphosphate phosphatase
MSLRDLKIDKTWTLFLDRDGVINHQILNNYVKTIPEFKFIDGVPEAVGFFSKLFGRIVIVTNQQGINRGLMSESQLHELHDYMLEVFKLHEGRIDKIYFAPQLATESGYYRKPGVGMGLHAKKDFPEIEFERSILIGDSETDIQFGTKLGMKTVLLKNGRNVSTKANYIFENLQAVANELKQE